MKKIDRIHPLIIIITVFGISWFGLYAKYFEDIQIPNRIVLSVIVLLTLYLVAGKEIFAWHKKSGRKALQISLYLLLLEFFVVILNYGNIIINNPNRIKFVGMNAVTYYVSLAVVTGIFEESLFRGIITGGLIKVMPKTKKGLYYATILSSLFFGFVHVISYIPGIKKNPVSIILQMVLVTIFNGTVGLLFSAILLRTKNLWICMIIHAVYDFMLFSVKIFGMSRSANINTKSDMRFVVIEGMLQIVLFIVPNVIIALKTIKNLTPQDCNIWRAAGRKNFV
jgi:hypothetical protein